jgi:hypothetical protein
MSVKITSLSFQDEFGNVSIPYLAGSVQDKIIATIGFTVSWNTLNVPMTFSAANKTITRTDSGSFISDGFTKNDSITISGTASNNGSAISVVSVTNTVITVSSVLVNEAAAGANIYGDTSITAIDFLYNLIENDSVDDFHSLSDNQTNQKFNAANIESGGVYPVTTTLTPITNSKGWLLDLNCAATTFVKWNSTTGHEQRFTITHTFFITPFFISDQLKNIQNGMPPAPDYYLNSKCLKYILRIDAKFDNLNADIPHTSSGFVSPRGNTAWFNEYLNGGAPEYSLFSISFQDQASGNSQNGIDFSRNTNVTIQLSSKSGRFVNNSGYPNTGSAVVLNQMYLPLDPNDYVNTSNKYDYDFMYDRKLLYVGNASANGEQFGTTLQQLTNIVVTFISVNKIQITYTTVFDPSLVARLKLKSASNRNYLISATPQQIYIP